jgi:hypothetical protein
MKAAYHCEGEVLEGGRIKSKGDGREDALEDSVIMVRASSRTALVLVKDGDY